MIVDALWYVLNTVIRKISKLRQLKKKSTATALNIVLLSAHPNDIIANLMELPDNR
jgi:hypothetical protein